MKSGIVTGVVVVTLFGAPAFAQREVSFKKDIRPLLNDYCVSCHAPGGKGFEASGLDLRSYESLMAGTKFGPVVKPGDSLGSTLVTLIEGHGHPSVNMPYDIKGTLSKRKIATLKAWVNQGARNN